MVLGMGTLILILVLYFRLEYYCTQSASEEYFRVLNLVLKYGTRVLYHRGNIIFIFSENLENLVHSKPLACIY